MAEPTQSPKTVAILGAGVMGSTLLSGLIRAGRDAADLVITDRDVERTQELAGRYGVRSMSSVDAAQEADTVVLVVKPQDMGSLIAEIRDHVRPGALVVSLAAGITTAFLEERLPPGTAVVRVMPNTPALVDEGMAAISPGQHCDEVHLREAEELLRSCGKVLRIAEKHLDAVTAISGSGPAYIFYVVEAMIEAGVLLGMPRATSTELVVQTLYGAATMLKETGQHPTVLREQVSSPGGTTMAAIRQLDDHKVRAAFVTAMEAAAQRSKQLAAGDG
jgi:pyrroline-5-carboxylate reductase